jgi:hypothetical protein
MRFGRPWMDLVNRSKRRFPFSLALAAPLAILAISLFATPAAGTTKEEYRSSPPVQDQVEPGDSTREMHENLGEGLFTGARPELAGQHPHTVARDRAIRINDRLGEGLQEAAWLDQAPTQFPRPPLLSSDERLIGPGEGLLAANPATSHGRIQRHNDRFIGPGEGLMESMDR